VSEVIRFGIDEHCVIRGHGANLPHWEQEDSVYHVCFRLADSLPAVALERIREEEQRLARIAARDGKLNASERDRLRRLSWKRIDDNLDEGRGAGILAFPACADIVVEALHWFDGDRYILHAYSVMPNHVHAIVHPIPPRRIGGVVGNWKSVTAHLFVAKDLAKAPVWQKEPFDHIIRSEKSYMKAIDYVIANPTAAGLKGWPWVWCASDEGNALR
jgi:REP element-mobilizing transposase RayT